MAGRIIGLIIILLGLPLMVSATSSATALYNKGNSLYAEDSFDGAITAYQEARATGLDNAALEYNLGNAYLKNDQLAGAILAYARAQRLSPRDPDIKFNLDFAKSRIRGEVPQVPKSLPAKILDTVAEQTTLNELSLLMSLGWFVLFAGLFMRVLFRSSGARNIAATAIFVGIMIMVLVLPFVSSKAKREVFTETAVIMEQTVDAHSGPGENNAKLFVLYEGMQVIITGREAEWSEVSIPGGLTGWIPRKRAESI